MTQNSLTTAARIAGGRLGAQMTNQGVAGIELPDNLQIDTPDDVKAIAISVAIAVANGRCTSAQAEAVLKSARLALDVLLNSQQDTIDRLVAELDRLVPGGR
jgi:hypothetical protein